MFCFMETWLHDDIPDFTALVACFQKSMDMRLCDNRKCGGIAPFVNNRLCNLGHVTMRKCPCCPNVGQSVICPSFTFMLKMFLYCYYVLFCNGVEWELEQNGRVKTISSCWGWPHINSLHIHLETEDCFLFTVKCTLCMFWLLLHTEAFSLFPNFFFLFFSPIFIFCPSVVGCGIALDPTLSMGFLRFWSTMSVCSCSLWTMVCKCVL